MQRSIHDPSIQSPHPKICLAEAQTFDGRVQEPVLKTFEVGPNSLITLLKERIWCDQKVLRPASGPHMHTNIAVRKRKCQISFMMELFILNNIEEFCLVRIVFFTSQSLSMEL